MFDPGLGPIHCASLLSTGVISILLLSTIRTKVNEVMHFDMVFHCVNDGLGNSMQRMKDWHEMMENMEISIRKRFMSKKK